MAFVIARASEPIMLFRVPADQVADLREKHVIERRGGVHWLHSNWDDPMELIEFNALVPSSDEEQLEFMGWTLGKEWVLASEGPETIMAAFPDRPIPFPLAELPARQPGPDNPALGWSSCQDACQWSSG